MKIHIRERWTINTTWGASDLVVFPCAGKIVALRHSSMLMLAKVFGYTNSKYWKEHGKYSITGENRISKALQDATLAMNIGDSDTMSGHWFNPADHDPTRTGGGGALPVGKHPVVIVGCTKEESQNNSANAFLALKVQIIDGPNKGVEGFYRLNIWHEKTTVKEIAHNQLSAVCAVTGTGPLSNGCPELFGRPFVIEVVPQPNSDKGYTQVQAVFSIQGEPPRKGALPAASQPSQPAGPPPGWTPSANPPASAWQAPQQQAAPQQAPAAAAWTPPGVGGPAQAPPWATGAPPSAAPAAPPAAQPAWAQQPGQAKPSW